MSFASDNAAPMHPKVLEYLTKANEGFSSSYGSEAAMERVQSQVREAFEAPEAAVYLVSTGTTANVLSLAVYAQPWSAIYCHGEAHIEVDECGAPEFYTGGARLVHVPGKHAKFTPEALRDKIVETPQGFVHSMQRGMVSLTNVTEMGTVYSAAEVNAVHKVCAEFDLPVHMDGARFTNAIVADGCSPAEMTWKAGIDVLSFGGTKNGLMGVEAVVLFDPGKAWEFELRRKRGGHLFSKHRYLSAQMEAYLADDLWLEMARNANDVAARLAQGIEAHPDCTLAAPAQANMLFVNMPRELHRKAMAAGQSYYLWPHDATLDGPGDETITGRLVCSWCTTAEQVDAFLDVITR